jgi:UDP-N-acetylbacillosamine N-acetyltransferase
MLPIGLLILGFGGHARSIADVAIDLGVSEIVFVDESTKPGENFFGFPVQKSLPASLPPGWSVLPAAGDNAERQRQIAQIAVQALPMGYLASRRAYLGKGSSIQSGSFVAHNAHLGPMAAIGRGTIINTGAVVDHESSIGDFSHISVNSTVAGRCTIGDLVFLGAGATVIDRICVCDRVVIGAGSTVVKDVTEPGVYVGVPARRLTSVRKPRR